MRRKELVKSLWLITQIGFSMLAPIAVGAVIGYYLDVWLGTEVLFLFFLLIGIAAGYRNVWHLVRKFTKNEPAARQQVIRKERKSPAQEEFERWRAERDLHSSGVVNEEETDEDEQSI